MHGNIANRRQFSDHYTHTHGRDYSGAKDFADISEQSESNKTHCKFFVHPGNEKNGIMRQMYLN
jgi:hypothetical protein